MKISKSYWEFHSKGPALPQMKKPCHDCAVVCNLYKEFSWALKLEPKDVQIRVSERWFCHNNPRKSCAGNWAEILK
jgi:hypothetical protein